MRKPYHKLTNEQRDEMAREFWRGGQSARAIGEKYGVSYQNVIDVSNKRLHIKEEIEREESRA